MTQDGEARIKRRTRPNTGSQDPLPLASTRAPGRSTIPPNTDTYRMDDELADIPRPSTSAIRYDQSLNTQSQRPVTPHVVPSPIPPRRQQGPTRELPRPRTTGPQQPPPKLDKRKPTTTGHKGLHVHWLFLVGVGMIAALALWVIATSAYSWGRQVYDDVHYGTPRTSQIEAVVGHGGDSPTHPSHFIAVNLNHQAIVTEFMAGDPAKSKIYVAPVNIVGSSGTLAPITLQFKDVTGDGKIDMIVHIQIPNQPDGISVFINDGTKFRPQNGNDRIQI